MAELTDATDVVADVAESVGEEAFELAETARGLDARALKFLFAGVGLGLVGGGLLGYGFANKRLQAKYEQIAEEEIDEMREHYRQRLLVREEKPDLATEASKIVEREGYDGPATPVLEGEQDEGIPPEEEEVFPDDSPERDLSGAAEEEAEEEVENVFDKDEPQATRGWDYEAEIARRRPEFPYVIHVDERFEKDNYTSTDLTYFEGDGVLADSDDKPVEEIDKVVGIANLDKFGHGSGDKDTVFIRNDVLELEVEVTREKGTYAEVVHGIKHSADPPRRRRAQFDDETSP